MWRFTDECKELRLVCVWARRKGVSSDVVKQILPLCWSVKQKLPYIETMSLSYTTFQMSSQVVVTPSIVLPSMLTVGFPFMMINSENHNALPAWFSLMTEIISMVQSNKTHLDPFSKKKCMFEIISILSFNQIKTDWKARVMVCDVNSPATSNT